MLSLISFIAVLQLSARRRSVFCYFVQFCQTHCNAMNCSMPGFPVLSHLTHFAQTHAQWVSETIEPSHPLSPSSPPAFNLSQCQGLLPWLSSSHHIPTYLAFSFSVSPSHEYSGLISFRIDWFDLLAVHWPSRVFSNTIVQKYRFFGIQPSAWPNSHIQTLLMKNKQTNKKLSFDYTYLSWQSNASVF